MKRLFFILMVGIAAFSYPTAAIADEVFEINVDQARVLRLERDAATVMIANPNIADVAIETARLIFVLGRAPGQTNIHILDESGGEILSTPVVVVPTLQRHVTIQRSVAEATLSCSPRCIEIPTPGFERIAPMGAGEAGSGEAEGENTTGVSAPGSSGASSGNGSS